MLKVGLTGGIGSGKSVVARLLAGHGAYVVDADRIAREVVEPGTEGLAEVVAEFGPGVLTPTGALDRSELGGIVFADAGARERLNSIVHPRVAERTAQLMAEAPQDAVVVYDVPLLVENHLQDAYDVVVVVDVDEETQVARLAESRGMPEDDARARIAAQAERQQRRAVADVVLDSSGSLAELEGQVGELWQRLQARVSGD